MNAAVALVQTGLSFGYRARGGPLQRARASFAGAWCAALMLTVILYENPMVLAAVLLSALVTAWRCGVLREVMASLALVVPLALTIGMVNPIASQQGITVLVAGIELPLLGTIDITSEALVYGAILALRALAIMAVSFVYVTTVDPDELLRLLRRYSVRSATTASLATRFVPVLARDGIRMAEARRCRPGTPPGTAAIVRAVFARAFDRASEASVALETRGFSLARPLRAERRPLGREDLWLGAGAALVTAWAVAGKLTGTARFVDYPLTVIGAGGGDIAFAVALASIALVPAVACRKAGASA